MQKYSKTAGKILIMLCMINTCYAQKMDCNPKVYSAAG